MTCHEVPTWGEEVRAWRHARRLTVRSAAATADVPHSTWAGWESGQAIADQTRAIILERLAEVRDRPAHACPGEFTGPARGGTTAKQCLRVLGVHWVSRGALWLRSEAEVLELLERARTSYRHQLRLAHPDRGGDKARCVEITYAWQRLRFLCRRHGIELAR